MTEQTKKALELAKKTFGDGRLHSSSEWDDTARKEGFTTSLRTVLKYLDHETQSVFGGRYGQGFDQFFRLK